MMHDAMTERWKLPPRLWGEILGDTNNDDDEGNDDDAIIMKNGYLRHDLSLHYSHHHILD